MDIDTESDSSSASSSATLILPSNPVPDDSIVVGAWRIKPNRHFKQCYQLGDMLGQGGHGYVFELVNRTGCVIKIVCYASECSFNHEYAMAKRMGQHGIGPKVYESCSVGQYYFDRKVYVRGFVMERLDYALTEFASIHGTDELRQLTPQVEKLIEHLAGLKCHHPDLHLNNFMVKPCQDGWRVYVIDFGEGMSQSFYDVIASKQQMRKMILTALDRCISSLTHLQQ